MITVTRPLLPPLDEFVKCLEVIWESKWITNMGFYHHELEKALSNYLGVEHISLFTNGTLPLITALQALQVTGEVITTPYSFVATTHALWWNGIRPVFADIRPETANIDPDKIEAAITPQTTAILPVHVYGTPCDTEKIQQIADRYRLKVIYDAAHAFGVQVNGESILKAGDMSTLSFHATKVFNTIEGGALICKDARTKLQIDYLKNFGFAGETTVVAPGINGKIDEVRAAFGLTALKYVDEAIESRRQIVSLYRKSLNGVKGIALMNELMNVRHNYSYFPVYVDEDEYGMSRDALYEKMKQFNIYGRRYFYPLISSFPPYRSLESARPENLPVATKMADSVICLPLYAGLEKDVVEQIISLILR